MESMGGDNENWNAVVPEWFTYYWCFIINRIHRSINPNAGKRNPSLKKKAKMTHRKMKCLHQKATTLLVHSQLCIEIKREIRNSL
jgi:hypothetical protein